MAAIAFISGVEVIYSEFPVSALSSRLLVLAITFPAKPYTGHLEKEVLLGFYGAIYLPVLEDSFMVAKDALFIALFVAFVTAVVRVERCCSI
jgi:hypothetical protein